MSWEDENYYLVAFDEERESIRHYRVDKIKNLSIIDEPVSDNETVRKFDRNEIMDVRWISIDELEKMSNKELRSYNSSIDIIKDAKENKQYSLDIIKNIVL